MRKSVILPLCMSVLLLILITGCSSSSLKDTAMKEHGVTEPPDHNLSSSETESSKVATPSKPDDETVEATVTERKDIVQIPTSIVWNQNGVQTTFLPGTNEYLKIYELMLARIPENLDELQDLLSESDMSTLLSCSSTVIFNYAEMVEIEYINGSVQSKYSYDKLYFPLEIYDNDTFSDVYCGVMIVSPRFSGSEGPLHSPDSVIEYLDSLQLN